jgi:putative endonuclease
MSWFVYLAQCADGSLYCGIARDIDVRFAAHNAGKGAKYTRGRAPVVPIAVRRCRSKSFALKLEWAVKQLPRPAKLELSDAVRFGALARRLSVAERKGRKRP